MNAKIIPAAFAAVLALTAGASAAGVSFSDSQKDLRAEQQAYKVAPTAGFDTPAAIDPAYSQRDTRLRAQGNSVPAETGSVLTTHGNTYVSPIFTINGNDPALGSN